MYVEKELASLRSAYEDELRAYDYKKALSAADLKAKKLASFGALVESVAVYLFPEIELTTRDAVPYTFSKGTVLEIYEAGDLWGDKYNLATVLYVKKNTIVITVRNIDSKLLQRGCEVDVVQSKILAPILMQHNTLCQIAIDPSVMDTVFHIDMTKQFNTGVCWDPQLNDEQQDAVRHAMGGHPITLIHGPPGTGKTTVIEAIIKTAMYQKKRVLVTAPSNAALDVILQKVTAGAGRELAEDFNTDQTALFVRLGPMTRTAWNLSKFAKQPKPHHRCVFATCTGSDNLEVRRAGPRPGFTITELEDLARDIKHEGEAQKALKHPYTIAVQDLEQSVKDDENINPDEAAAARLRNRSRANIKFDLVIVDESSQASVLESLIPIMRTKGKIILVGDQNQLPPGGSSYVPGESLFVKLLDQYKDNLNDISVMLTRQYRMNETIMKWPANEFYDGKLVADESCRDIEITKYIRTNYKSEHGAVLWIDTVDVADFASEELQMESKFNRFEADVALKYTQYLLEHISTHETFPRSEICIMSPYVAQVNLLKQLFDESQIQVRIGTVDSFQGQEAEVVILNLVRSNTFANLGFLEDWRRLNVAFTRGKRQVVVIGNSSTVCFNDRFASLYEYVKMYGYVVPAAGYLLPRTYQGYTYGLDEVASDRRKEGPAPPGILYACDFEPAKKDYLDSAINKSVTWTDDAITECSEE